MSDFKLRDYQREACEAVWQGWREKPRQLLVLATGAGKTYTAGRLVHKRRESGRCLWLAHRIELLDQAAEAMRAMGLTVQVERGDDRADRDPRASDVVVASVPTLHKGRLDTWPRHAFSTIVADEAHHARARTWVDVLDHFDTDALGRRCRVLGLTATPDRGDQLGLWVIFDQAAYTYGLREAIRDGWLVPLAPPKTVICEDLDLSQVRVIAGELSASELEEQVSRDAVLHQIARPLVDLVKGRPTIVYTPGVASAQRLAVILSGYVGSDRCASIDGGTPKDVRRTILDDFRRGALQFVTNCMVLTEGTDLPPAAAIAVARPTKSRSLLAQMVGRGTRTLPGIVDSFDQAEDRRAAIAASGKPDCLIVDFTGRDAIDLVGPLDVLAGDEFSEDALAEAAKLHDADPERPLEEVLAEAEQMALDSEAGRELERRNARVQAKVGYSTHAVDLPGFGEAHVAVYEEAVAAAKDARRRDCKRCHGTGEGKAGPCGVCKGKGKVKGVSYYEKGPSPKQVAFLERHGISLPESALRRQASAAVEVVITRGLCSVKQAKVLRRAGLRTDLSKSDAGAALNALSSSGWQTTPEIVERFG